MSKEPPSCPETDGFHGLGVFRISTHWLQAMVRNQIGGYRRIDKRRCLTIKGNFCQSELSAGWECERVSYSGRRPAVLFLTLMPLKLSFLRTWPRLLLPLLGILLGGVSHSMSAAELTTTGGPLITSFRAEMAEVLDEYCYDCHGFGTAEGGVTLDEFSSDADFQDHDLWLAVLNNVRKGIMPPAEEFQPTPSERERIASWIKDTAFALDPAQPDPGRITLRRLNRVEYENTIRDLLGVDFDAEIEFPADDSGHGFDNIADVLTVSPMLLEKYLDAAQTIVNEAVPQEPLVVAENWLLGRDFESLVEIQPETAELADTAGVEAADEATAVESRPSAEIWQAGNRGRNHLQLSYYQPARVAQTMTVYHAGEYDIVFDLRLTERYVDNQFDLNEAALVLKLDGEVLHERKLVREGWQSVEIVARGNLEPGEHSVVVELYPSLPAQEQIRDLGVRINHVIMRGPLTPEHWVAPKRYADYFPRPVPDDARARDEYRREVLGAFAERAYRHPVHPRTVEALVEVARGVSSQPGSNFEKGVAQAMVAVLASPGFLFREEGVLEELRSGTVASVDEFALASRLSYFLWSSMPDDELFALAKAGELRANLPAQLARMLADSRSSELVENFTGQWLQARDVLTVPIQDFDVHLRENRDPELLGAYETFREISLIPRPERTPEQVELRSAALDLVHQGYRSDYPRFNNDLRESMQRETELYFDHILREDRSVMELLDSDYTFVNEALAKHYGLDTEGIEGEELRKVTLPPDSVRGGVLTQGTLLAVTSNPTRTSPVKRGVFILENILGAPPPPPPPNIPGLEDAVTEEELGKLSLRETLALHASQPTCASCHLRMDPLGLALENFNAMGRFREEEMNLPIQPEGKLISGESFTDIRELKRILANERRDDFLHTLVEKMLTYALGRGMEYYDIVTIDQIVDRIEAKDFRMSALIEGIVNSAPFQQTRIVDSAVAQALQMSDSLSLSSTTPSSP